MIMSGLYQAIITLSNLMIVKNLRFSHQHESENQKDETETKQQKRINKE